MKRLSIFVLLTLLLTGCGIHPAVQKEVQVEAGEALSTEVTDYASLPDSISSEDVSLYLDDVDINTPGDYDAHMTYNNKDYSFVVHVMDTVAPSASRAMDYIISTPGILHASDYVTDISDATKITVGFVGEPQKRADLSVMNTEEIEADAASDKTTVLFSENSGESETSELSADFTFEDEGIYDGQIAVQDAGNNRMVFDFTFYIDGTPPVITDFEDGEMELSESDDGIYELNIKMTITDNFDGDITNTEQVVSNIEEYDDYVDASVTATDRAGNEVSKQAKLTFPDGFWDKVYEKQLEQFQDLMDQLDGAYQSQGSSSSGSSSNSSSSGSSSSQKDQEARAVAQSIADQCTSGSDLERVRKAAQLVNSYCAKGTYTSSDPDYRTAYGLFCKGVYTCAGTTRAMGLVLDCMGFSWQHMNPNQWTHQWCALTMDGQPGWADGMGGIADYGDYPLLNGGSYTASDGTVYTLAQ